MKDVLETQNESYGFYGTMLNDAAKNNWSIEKAWELASNKLLDNTPGNAKKIRAFLDSRSGRHFADDVHNGLHSGKDLKGAIDYAIEKWKGWKAPKDIIRQYKLAQGTNYLEAEILAAATGE